MLSRIEDNSVPATAFKAIKAPRVLDEREENETEKGLRIADRGFLNTAVIRSEITHIDGEAGSTSFCKFELSQVKESYALLFSFALSVRITLRTISNFSSRSYMNAIQRLPH